MSQPAPNTESLTTQQQAFKTAAGSSVGDYAYLWMGMLFMFLFLWAAWVAVVAYKGWAAGDVSPEAFGGALLRVMLLFVISCAFFLS